METVELKIIDVAYGGKGVARLDGCVVFIPGVLTGETVKAEITSRRKKFAEARALEIITASPARISPACPLASLCPGCCYQHSAYSEEIKNKQNQFLGLLKRMGKVDASCCLEPVSSPINTAYRNKITLHASVENENVMLGYYGEDNTSIIDIPQCPLAVEPINSQLTELRANRDFMQALNTKTSVTLRYTERDGAIYWKGTPDPKTALLTESTVIGDLQAPRDAFFQVNPSVAPILIEKAAELVGRIKPEFLIDMYCGIGIFALAAARNGVPHTLGIDAQRTAVEAATANARQLGIEDRALFLCGDAGALLKKAMQPVDPNRTAIVFDPPRRGLNPSIIRILGTRRPHDIIYISCAADTLARDIALLGKEGYAVVCTQLIDMFPRTQYFESITHLSLA